MAVAIPEGYAGFVHPRSGLAHRLGLSLVNAPGTIDAGYRGEIKVNLVNLDPTTPITLRRGDRVAQLVVQPVVRARFVPVEELPGSDRGSGGHGSTGGSAHLGRPPPSRPREELTCRSDDAATASTAACASAACRPEPQVRVREVDETTGPWDETDVPDDGPARIDLGALRLPALAGMELRVEVGPQGQVVGATLRDGESLLSVAAFAAPRAGGLWDDVRAEIAPRRPPGRADR